MKAMMIKCDRKIDTVFSYVDKDGNVRKEHLKAGGRGIPDKTPGYHFVSLYLRNGREVQTVDCPTAEQLRQCAQLLIDGHVRDLGGARQMLRKLLRGLKCDPLAKCLANQL